MTRALLVDLDGVIRLWDKSNEERAERVGRLPSGAVRAAAFAKDLLEPVITGRVTDEEWRAGVAERLRKTYPDSDAASAVRVWSESPGRVDREVVEVLRARRGSVALALITNATSRLPHDLEQLGLTTELDHVFNSADLGFVKPDPRIFQRVLEELELQPFDAFFVDDNAGHVAAAARLGIHGHHYKGLRELCGELSRVGLLDGGPERD